MEKQVSTIHERKALPLSTNIAYGSGDMACNIVYGMATSLITLFYTDYVGISAAAVAVVMLWSRMFDGVSDVIMGFIVSHTKSKWGQARAWVLWMAIPYGIGGILLFTVPHTDATIQFWYIFLTYNLATTAFYTMLNVPYGTLAALMTRNAHGRDMLSVFRMGLSPIGRILSVVLTMPLVKLFGDNQMAWVKTMCIWAVVAGGLILFCFAKCKETVHIEAKVQEKISLKRNIKGLLTNVYFWAVLILCAVQAAYNTVIGTVMPYYCKYILGNDTWMYSMLYLLETLILIGGIMLCPLLRRRFSKRGLAIVGSIISVGAQLLLREEIDEDAIVVAAAGSLPADLERLWVTDAKDSYNMEYGASCMGYEVAGALGSKMAAPDKEVYSLVGDGSFLMLNSELATAVQEQKKITVIVFDNAAFGCINNLQMGNGIGSLATEMRYRNEETGKMDGNYVYTDFAKIGEGYGMKSFTAKTPDEFREAVRAAKKESGSCLIDAKVLPKTMAEGYESWWHIGVASTSKSEKVQAARKRVDDKLAEARMY